MKRQIILRGLIGIPIGITLGYVITIIISCFTGEGTYVSCVPTLTEAVGSELNAVILQTILCGVLGMAFGAESVIWEMESWSILKQTGVYFLISAVIMLPIAYMAHWMEHSLVGVLEYAGIFLGIFVVMWISMYLKYRGHIKKLNAKLEQ